MDKDQAKTVADAILEPHLREQKTRASRAHDAKVTVATNRRRGRIALLFLLAGTVIGGTAAYFIGSRPSSGLYWGLIAGGLIGWAVAYAKVRSTP